MPVGIIGHPQCSKHNMGEHHPESPQRMSAIGDQLIRSGLDYIIRQFDAKTIDPKLLTLVHSKQHIDYIFDNAPNEGRFTIDGDTSMNPDTLNSVLTAAGAAVDAVDLVMNKTIASAFCATRPPGHHAEPNKAMGFCFFNNIAIAAAYAKQKYKLDRIAIVDFDVHHGNGTEAFVRDNPGYLFCSTFQHPLYPYSGTEMTQNKSNNKNSENKSIIINTPLAANSNGIDFRQAIINDWLPALNDFKPQIIFISAGFDAHIEDDISQLNLTETDYQWVTTELKNIANKYAQGRIISILEGGYALSALGRSVVAHIKGLI